MLIGLLIAGCGGGGSSTVGTITGFIEDVNGNPVRNARVYVDGGPQTYSNSAGSYRLVDASGDVRIIKASVNQDGVNYFGENTVQIFNGETSKSVNVTVAPSNQLATLTGTVTDRNGDLVQNAHVFAAATNGGGTVTVFSSSYVLTDSSGNFSMPTLLGGQSYTVVASAVGYDSDPDTVTIPAGQTQNLLFTLKNATDPLLPAPTNLFGQSWTTPHVSTTRVQGQQAALEAVKNMIDPRRSSHRQTRDTSNGNFVEIDLEWDAMSDPSLIGFEIYRAPGNVGVNSLQGIDFYRDPLATLYEDMDASFQENQTYSYAITAFNTNAGDTNNSESGFSNEVVVTTLGDLFLDSVTTGPLTFHWEAASGAQNYQVYVFDRIPSVGITSIWNANTTSTQLAYGGPALTSGHTYYYVVLGQTNDNTGKTLSLIDSFVAP
ncbi:MAG TPA: carboxypeptidase-like regulatory domain-containing protein [Fimbriimonadaceae bacterium]|nr:carboxypeptidase-like regulatory domain-containing protein [Fimbriimonadaceae bacterium]